MYSTFELKAAKSESHIYAPTGRNSWGLNED